MMKRMEVCKLIEGKGMSKICLLVKARIKESEMAGTVHSMSLAPVLTVVLMFRTAS